MNFSLTTILLLAAVGGSRGYDDYDVSVQTQDVPFEETPSPSPYVDTDSLEPTPSPSPSSTALSTFVQSIVPTGGTCDVGGGRKLRGSNSDTQDKDKEEDDILNQLQHDVFRKLVDEYEVVIESPSGPCLIQGPTSPFAPWTCLVITDISYFMTIFYSSQGAKHVIANSDVTHLLKQYLLGEASDIAQESIWKRLEWYLEQFSEIGLDTIEELTDKYENVFPTEKLAEVMAITALGIDFHAQISGDVYTWTCPLWGSPKWKYTGKYKSLKFPLFPENSIMCTTGPPPFLAISDPNFVEELIRGFKCVFQKAMDNIKVPQPGGRPPILHPVIKNKIIQVATGTVHNVVVWGGRLLKP